MLTSFKDDSKDRKRRFLRGLNAMLGCEDLEDKDIPLGRAIQVSIGELRNRLANVYCLEFTQAELRKLAREGVKTGEFTEKYCPVIYESRSEVDINALLRNTGFEQTHAVDLSKLQRVPKYGLNGSEWCDVSEGPCSCGAWHK